MPDLLSDGKVRTIGKTQVVTAREDAGRTVHDFRCPIPTGCGTDGQPFTSTGWTVREAARDRARQHLTEHDDGTLMPELTAATAAAEPVDWEV